MTSKTKKGPTRREILTILISSVAVFVSFASLYFSHFHVSHKIEAVVLEADPAGGDLIYQVAIINPGNRKALIKSASLQLMNPGEGALHVSNPFSSVRIRQPLPAVIEEASIMLLTFQGPLSFRELYERGSTPDPGSGLEEFNGEPTKKVLVTATFESMDFKGDVYRAETGVMSAHITQSSVAGWYHDGATRSLFVKK
jgi:hypothetical protein